MRQNGGERGQRWNDDPDWRRYHHECRPAGLQPNAVVIAVGHIGVSDPYCSPRQVPHNRAPIRIKMIVAMAGIVMLVVRLELFPGTVLLAALRVGICLI
jgi:hypothetical protein